jgi:hypothetical protein
MSMLAFCAGTAQHFPIFSLVAEPLAAFPGHPIGAISLEMGY